MNDSNTLLILEDITNRFENCTTLTPRSKDVIDQSLFISDAYQCGNSWYFLNHVHKRWQQMYELDMEGMKWMEVKSVVDNSDDDTWTTAMHTIVSDGERAYWYGGSTMYYNQPVNHLRMFTCPRKEWSEVVPAISIDSAGGELPSLEYCAATQPLDTDELYRGGPCLFTFGGFSFEASSYSDEFHRFDILSKTWTKLDAVVKPLARSGASLVHLSSQEKLLLYGGSGNRTVFEDLWAFDFNQQRNGWQKVIATGEAPTHSAETPRPVVVIRGPHPKIVVFGESHTTKEILLYILDCLTLHWTVLNSHIQMELSFASIFQPKSSDGNHFFLYLAPSHAGEYIYSVSIQKRKLPLRLYEASQLSHFSDTMIKF